MTPTEKYIAELMRSRDKAVSRFQDMTSIERMLIDNSFTWLTDNLDIKSGKFQVSENLNSLMNDFVNSVLDMINGSKSYKNKISDYFTDINKIGKNMEEFQKQENGIDFKKFGVNKVQKGVVKLTIDALTESGLNASFAQPLKDMVQLNVAAGITQKDAQKKITDFISSGKDKSGKLKNYVHNVSLQSVQLYEGAINAKLMQEFEFTGFIMAGSLIETSSQQCRKALDESDKGYLTNDQMEGILKFAKTLKNDGGLIEGTTLDNLPVNLLHWGCRHSFTPIIREKK